MPSQPKIYSSRGLLAVLVVFVFFRVIAAAAGKSNLPAIRVLVDGATVVSSGGSVTIPTDAKSLSFEVGEPLWNAKNPHTLRLRYQLQGVDHDWVQRTTDMGLVVYFYDENHALLGRKYFPATGESPGWNGVLDQSKFVRRTESFQVPARARTLSLVLSSAGSPEAVGIYAIGELTVFRDAPKGGSPLLFHMPLGHYRVAADGSGAESEWRRDGTHASMAKVIALDGGSSSTTALGIVDNDTAAHAEWYLLQKQEPKVTPGETVTLAWTEMYSIGCGNMLRAYYGMPRVGSYRFRINEVDELGRPKAGEESIAVVIPRPYWRNPWFWAGGLLVTGLPLLLVGRHLVKLKIRRQMEYLKQEHLMEMERLRIARDIHDDLGAGLTHISLVSSTAESETMSIEEAREHFQKIAGMTKTLVSSLYETVWTVDPENDRLESMVNHLIQILESLCEPAGLRCRIKAATVPKHRAVSSEVRHNLSLAVKEAVHNAVKYSRGTEVTLRIDWVDPVLTVTITDDGIGFDVGRAQAGHGLANMRQRMNTLGGTIRLAGGPGKGTCLKFELPIR
ncbi:MAG TPA: sensor histidine kinase [Rariglobus sp.]|jgi:signal transduction histidine kinase|nr:sensor histidine kinase [Rariglobus sp.]